jgi:hypothetical protein
LLASNAGAAGGTAGGAAGRLAWSAAGMRSSSQPLMNINKPNIPKTESRPLDIIVFIERLFFKGRFLPDNKPTMPLR